MKGIKDYLWFEGFRLFYTFAHPTLGPLKLLRQVVRKFGHREFPTVRRHASPKTIPKKIWILWLQGWDNAPPLINICRDSWIANNPEWEVIALDKNTIPDYVTLDYSLDGKEVSHAAYSDIIRINLLSKYGGVWADATTFCRAPLNGWLPNAVQSGFFAFNKPKTTIASWFLAAEKNNALVGSWEKYIERYWKVAHKAGRYFWVHYLFEYLIKRDANAGNIWSQTPRIDSKGSYEVQRCLKRGGVVIECSNIIWKGISPVHKLDRKMQFSEEFLQVLKAHSSM